MSRIFAVSIYQRGGEREAVHRLAKFINFIFTLIGLFQDIKIQLEREVLRTKTKESG